MPLFKSHTADQLFEPIVEILKQHPQGLSEHELLHALTEAGFLGFDPALLSEDLVLFQTHFFLFHVLYRLRDMLHAQQRYELEIFCLDIRLTPYEDEEQQQESLVEADPLREYYLDLKHLHETDAAEVRGMLTGFYQRLEAFEKRQEAYKTLGLEEGVSKKAVRQRYRSLVKKHHPDQGGDREMFQQVEQAMKVLNRLYQ